jgi:hypothetical protein
MRSVAPILVHRPAMFAAPARVDLFYATGGVEPTLAETAVPFSFSNVPMAVHAIRVVKTVNPQAGSVVAQDTMVVRPSSTTAVELWF